MLAADVTPEPARNQAVNTALLAQYLALINFPPKALTDADFRKMNELVLQLAMELPDDVLTVLFKENRTWTYQDAWDAVDVARKHTRPGDPRSPDNMAKHGHQNVVKPARH